MMITPSNLQLGTKPATLNPVAPQCASTPCIVKTERILSSLQLSFFYARPFMAGGVIDPKGQCSLIIDASYYVRQLPSNCIEVADLIIRGFTMLKLLPDLLLLAALLLALGITVFIVNVPGGLYL